jgi:hypothetical protein
MKVRLLHPRMFEGKLYPAGVHNLPDKLKDNWFFQAQVEQGHASQVVPEAEAKPLAKPPKPGVSVPVKPQPQK